MSQTKAQLISDLVQALNFTGTASAPSNGAFLSAANTLAFATNSAQRLTIDSSGKVGIGTTSPETLLHAKINTFSDDINKVALTLSNNQSSGVHQYFQNASTGTGVSNGARIGLGNTDNFLIQHFEAKDIQISTNGTERMRINSSGNVGIGISSSIDRALHIVNNSGAIVKMEANYSGSVTGIEGVLTASGANRYVVGMYGKVVNTSSTESDVARIRFYNEQASPTSSDSPGYITFDTTPDGSATPTERMRISSAGNVGIGTTSPGEKLDVAGTIQLTNFLKATGDLLLCADIDNNNSGTALRFCVDGDQSAEKMRIDDSGNVGIGTTSPTKPSSSNANTRFMEISSADGADLILGNSATSVSVGDHIGTLAFKNVDSNPDSGVPHYAGIRCESANTSGSMDLRFYVGRGNLESDATNMIISAAGNVGIGTSSPDVNFHVSGTSSVAKIESTASATSARLIIKSETDTYTGLHFGDTGDDDVGRIRYYHTDNHMQFSTGASERLRIDSDGKVAIGTSTTSMNGNGLKIFHANFPSLQLQNNATGTGATVGAEFILSSGGALQLVQRSSEATIFKTANTERMRIDNVGNVGIGTSSAVNNSGYGGITLNGGNGAIFSFKDSDVEKTRLALVVNDAFSIQYPPGSSGHFRIDSLSADGSGNITGATERLRVHSGGEISFQTTSINLQGGGASDFMFTMRSDIGSNHNGVMIAQVASGHAALTTKPSGAHDYFAGFFLNNNSSGVGSIQITASATIFNTSSDYRLKENAVSISDGITRLKQLLPKRFNWIADETNTLQDGFFAHEVSSIVPEAVTGEKDAIATEDGGQYTKDEPIYQQIDHSKLVPLLTAALKEAISKIETLETKVAALEAA